MDLNKTVAVVTGANRGLGRHLAAGLVERGAKVYAAARNPETVDLPGVIPLRLDVTDAESITAAAQIASDVTLLVNNAGISTSAPLIGGDIDDIRREMDVNFYGPARRDPGVCSRHRKQRRRNNTQRSVGAVLVPSSRARVLRVVEGSGLGDDRPPFEKNWRRAKSPYRHCMSHTWIPTWPLAYPPNRKIDPADVAAQALDGIESGLAEILG